jgi:hypothetical protein
VRWLENPWPLQHRGGGVSKAIVGSAVEALQVNCLRSFLTILGVIIGVSAVIAVVSLSPGGQSERQPAVRQPGHQCDYDLLWDNVWRWSAWISRISPDADLGRCPGGGPA